MVIFRFLLIGLFFFGFGQLLFAQTEEPVSCPCQDCPRDIVDGDFPVPIDFHLNIFNLQNNDLSDPNQCVKRVGVTFTHDYSGDLEMSLISPTGQEVRLIGPQGTFGKGPLGQTQNRFFEVTFVKPDVIAMPDDNYESKWENDQEWVGIGDLTGSYYPNRGTLDDFNQGQVNGTWTLRVIDGNPDRDEGELIDFFVEFCDFEGLVCDPCLDDEDDPTCFFTVDPGEKIAVPDEEFCLPIYVKNVAFVRAMSFPIRWDPTILEFLRVDSLGNENLSPLDFNTTSTNIGFLTFNYVHPQTDTLGLVLADSTKLFNICFKATGAVGDSSLLFVSRPPIAVNVDSQQLEPNIFQGVVKVAVDSTADCVRAIQICNNDTISINKSKGSGFEEFEGQSACSDLGEEYQSKWFQFDVLEAGLLEFLIKPKGNASYGFSLYRGACPNDAGAEIIFCEPGFPLLEGRSVGAATDPQSSFGEQDNSGFQSSLNAQEGETYFLMVDNFSENGVGFDLIFGGTASIGDDIVQSTIIDPEIINCTQPTITLDASASTQGNRFEPVWTTDTGRIDISQSTYQPTITKGGNFTFAITDKLTGCVAKASVLVETDQVYPQAEVNNGGLINCTQSTFDLNSAGSSNGEKFEIIWSNLTTTIPDLPATEILTVDVGGDYELKITNTENGCISRDTTLVNADFVNPELTVNDSFISCQQASTSLIASSTTKDVRFEWESPMLQTNIPQAQITATDTGYYQITVTALNGCQTVDTAFVFDERIFPKAEAGDNLTLNCALPINNLDGNGTDEGQEFEYQWSTPNGHFVDGTGTSSLTPRIDSVGTYILRVKNSDNGCVTRDTTFVDSSFIKPTIRFNADSILNCYNPVLEIDATQSDSGAIYSFDWFVEDGNPIQNVDTYQPSITEAGSYILNIKNEVNGCQSSRIWTVKSEVEHPFADAGISQTVDCNQPSIGLDGRNSSQGAIFSYDWTTQDGNFLTNPQNIEVGVDSAGTYLLTVLNEKNGCTSQSEVEIFKDFVKPALEIPTDSILTCRNPTLSMTAISTTPNTNFSWLLPKEETENGSTIETDIPGEFIVTATAANGCIRKDSLELVAEQTFPTISIERPDTLICTRETIQILGDKSEQGANFSFNWSTSSGEFVDANQNAEINPIVKEGGFYSMSITNNKNGCIAVDSIEVIDARENPSIEFANEPDIFTCSNEEVAITALTDATNASFEWKFSSVTKSEEALLTADAPGVYTIIVTNLDNNCIRLSSIEIEADTVYPMADAGPAKELNCAIGAVELDASLSDKGSAFSYLWTTPSNTQITDSLKINGTEPGLYNLIVINKNNGCRTSDTVNVAESRDNPIADAGMDTIFCSGVDSDVLDIVLGGSLTSGGSNFAYTWLDSKQEILGVEINQRVFEEGVYTLSVLNKDNNCFITDSVRVFEKTGPKISLETEGAINCRDNEIQYLAKSDIPNTVIKWIGETELEDSILIVTDALLNKEFIAFAEDTITGCKGASDVVRVFADTLAPLIDAGKEAAVDCLDTLSLKGQILSANIEFDANWSTLDGSFVTSTNKLKPIIEEEGTYILEVENINNFCRSTDTVLILSDKTLPILNLDADTVLTCDFPKITLKADTLSEGDNFYYNWTENKEKIVGNEKDLAVEFAGTYQLTVIDSSNFCSRTAEVMVQDSLNPPTIIIDVPESLTCVRSEVILNTNINVEDGTYQWSILSDNGNILGAQNSPDLLVDSAGIYQIEVTNNFNGCVSFKNIEVADLRANLSIEAGNDKTITCFNDTTVLAAGTIFNQTPHQIFEWTSDNINFSPIDSSLIFTIREEGKYYLNAIDTLSFCEVLDSFIVDKNITPVSFPLIGERIIDCATDQLILTSSDTNKPANYLFDWSTEEGNILTGTDSVAISVDEGGVYYVNVEDGENGCNLFDSTLVIDNRIIPTIDLGDKNALTCMEDTLLLGGPGTVIGENFIYKWEAESGNILEGENTPFALVAEPGIYTFLVTDTSNACIASEGIQISLNKTFPKIQTPQNLTFDCSEETITIEPTVAEEISNLTFTWNTLDGKIVADSLQISPVINQPGTYFVEVMNLSNECITKDSLTILDIRDLPKVGTLEDKMLGCTNTSITLSAQGSEIGDEIQYEWINEVGNTLSNNTTLTLSEPGLYILAVKNTMNNCINTDTVQISENFDPPTGGDFLIESPTCDDSNNGHIEVLEVVGGTAPFKYALNNFDTSFVQLFPDLTPQTYNLTIIDELNCTWDTTILLNQPEIIEVAILSPDNQFIMGEEGAFSFETSILNTEIADIIWTPSELFDCFNCESVRATFRKNTSIGLTIIDQNGCEGTDSILVEVALAPTPNVITPNGDGANDYFMIPEIELTPDAFPESELIIFNRWGDVLYKSTPYLNDWDGRNNQGNPLPEGTYYYVLRLDSREGEVIRGDITIIRR